MKSEEGNNKKNDKVEENNFGLMTKIKLKTPNIDKDKNSQKLEKAINESEIKNEEDNLRMN